ncbi:hypothetical protein [Guptibacillus hwajinpoensis]|uniref:hypothetical protein n=1 Tax=Guptibacillus hwajinpoensis TaxID=208199 RepID=UPI00273F82FA|nr:hypothetical protein [Pseudalkalibacillus hwajinpoensis]WLR60630.1 hypothetical protein LC071_04545 [Pseudalkalibacillus hwajinpoensis]
MFNIKDVSIRTVAHTLCLGTAVSLSIWADKLTAPIKDINIEVLSSEAADSLISGFVGIIKNAVGEPYEPAKMSYDMLWNLAIPCFLLLISVSLLAYITKDFIFKSFEEQESQVDFVLKIILVISLIIVSVFVLIKFVQLLFFNLIVAGVALFIYAILFAGIKEIIPNSES